MKPISLNPMTFPFAGTALIEASAGTGKTYTLAALYVRLIIGHGDAQGFGRPLLPPDILVVTFTNAATLELRDRIRTNLSEIANVFRGISQSQDPFTESLLAEIDQSQHLATAQQLERAADWMDEAAIFTIHGWAQRMLTAHAFDSDTLFDQSLSDDGRELLEEACRDYWRVHCSVLDTRVADQLGPVIGSPVALYRWIKRSLALESELYWANSALTTATDPRDLAPDILQWQHSLEEAQRVLRACWESSIDDIEASLLDACEGNAFKKTVRDKMKDRLLDMRRWIEGEALTSPQKLIASLHFTQSHMLKGHTLPTHAASDLIQACVDINDQRPAMHSVLLHAYHWIANRFNELKAGSGVLDFDDLLVQLRQGLKGRKGASLADRIRQQYPVAMIDEFQDTDPQQFDIFNTLYHQTENTCWIMIGDPKQAIYSFRGADIHTYLSARENSRERLYTLDTNYRSSSAMVNAVNALFDRAERSDKGAFLFKDDPSHHRLPFEPVQANGLKDSLVHKGEVIEGLRLMTAPPDVHLDADAYRIQMSDACAARIAGLLNDADQNQFGTQHHAIQPSDMAVLVRNGTEAKAIRKALLDRGVASVYLSDKESIFESREAIDLWRMLSAIINPKSQRLMMAALASKTFCMDHQYLYELQTNERLWESEAQRFLELHLLWKQSNVAAVIRALMMRFSLPEKLAAMYPDKSERIITNIIHLGELLQVQAAKVESEHAILRYLSDRLSDPAMRKDDQLVRMESDSGRVQVITMHKSKGLEYPVVFVPFGVSGAKVSSGKGEGIRYREGTESRLELSSDPSTTQRADLERLQEDIRLLYVALTRAKYSCWLGICHARSLPESPLASLLGLEGKYKSDRLSESLQQAIGRLLEDDHITEEPIESDSRVRLHPSITIDWAAPAVITRSLSAERWSFTSYSAIAHRVKTVADDEPVQDKLNEPGDPINTSSNFDEAAVNTIHAFARGAVPGNYLHEVLERAAEFGFANTANHHQLIEDALQMDLQIPQWQSFEQVLNSWLSGMLLTPIEIEQGIALADLKHYASELEFMFSADHLHTEALDQLCRESIYPALNRSTLEPQAIDGVIKGFIDLTFEINGRYWVCDYKSNWLGPNVAAYGEVSMQQALVEHRYDLQLMIYLLALHRMLLTRDADYRRDPKQGYEQRVGGAVYLYIRGIPEGKGTLAVKPTYDQIMRCDALFRSSGDL